MNASDDEQLESRVGPIPKGEPQYHPYHHPAAGWGAAKSVTNFLMKEAEYLDGRAIMKMNHENTGFDCPGCAWPDDIKGLKLDLCENGVKHVAWEMTHKRVTREFFAKHSVSELFQWSDYDLEDAGRLTEPMVYDPDTDHYVPISWKDAFELFGRTVRASPPLVGPVDPHGGTCVPFRDEWRVPGILRWTSRRRAARHIQ